MKKLLIVVCAALAAPMVFAQAKSFEGPSIGANIVNTKTTIEGGGASIDGTTSSLELNAQYNFALAPQFVLGVGLTLGTGNNKAGTDATPTDYTTKNRYALEFTPGYAVSDTLLVFGKIAAINATGVSDTAGTTTSDTYTGVGYGIGVRGAIDKNLYWLAGYDSNQYNEKNGNKAKSTTFAVGVGYKF